ncbi:MAG: MBOAT family O-acyltransferase [Myxococcota bacterium]
MLFNSFEYVLFLVLTCSAFWGLVRYRLLRTVMLLLSSYVFYMSWNASFLVLIVGSTAVDYCVAIQIYKSERPWQRKALLAISLTLNLGLLGLFKYADFAVGAFVETASLFGFALEPTYLHLVLPVGISFYTFQTLSYSIDVYRGTLKPTRSFLEFATFVAFFPQLVAGPIVRASEFLPQFDKDPRLRTHQVGEGLFLILCGMMKKVLVADFLAIRLIDRVFENPGTFSSAEVWFAVYAYTWQLYGDFSGYTDIARGSARLFDFELPRNFDRPFQTTGPIEFWRCWHMTLSRWVQDYIYIPLGGSRISPLRSYANLFFSFVLIGVWHGAGWTFVLFGIWHATGVTLNRLYRSLRTSKEPFRGWKKWLSMLVSVHFFVIHWPIFRSPNVERMMEVYEQMFAFSGASMRVDGWVWTVFIAVSVVHFTPRLWVPKVQSFFVSLPAFAQAAVVTAIAALLLYVGSEQAAPFVYFQF